ncbi:glycoside hydrolase family 2 protein [Reichenbachiella sp.]|uniref:beta-mannosidase n=1 Tax=Reichenbachiella sp. TaxID=2184521 RepID=UPI0032990B3A
MSKIERGHHEEGYKEWSETTVSWKHAVQSKVLNTDWKMRQVGTEEWLTSRVPGTNFTSLYEAKKIQDPFYGNNEGKLQWIEKEDWEYQTTFNISEADLLHEKLELVFEGLDTYADVYINENLVLQADNMFLKWHLACKKYLNIGLNDVRIYFHSPLKIARPELSKYGLDFPAENDKTENHLSVFTRKAPYHYGWDWGPKFITSGIWRPVSLRLINDLIIRNLQIHQASIIDDLASFSTTLTIESCIVQDCTITATIGEEEVGSVRLNLTKGINDCVLPFAISDAKRWWPAGMGDQILYDVVFEVKGLEVSDSQTRRVGVREFEVVNQPDEKGESFYFKVNGIPFFAKGANYIPSDSFPDRMTPARYKQVFEDAVAANMNTLRVWGGGIYEDDLFYDLADEYGIVIWQDFMFACTMYPWDQKFLENVEKEAVTNIRRLRNHPCIGLWCGNNEVQMGWDNWGWQKSFDYSDKDQERMYEGYKKLFHTLLPGLVEEYDPGRFYLPSSPISNWDSLKKFNYGDQHYWGVWHGEEPFENFKKFVPRFMSEFGFQAFPLLESVTQYIDTKDQNIESEPMKVHQKHPRGNQLIKEYMLRDFIEPKDFENFLYLSQILQAQGMTTAFEAHRRNMPFCMGSLYWQFNDCWPVASWSGIDYYGRWKALHYAARHAFDNLLISFEEEGSTLKGYLISDLLEETKGVLSIEVRDFYGNELYKKAQNVSVEANKSAIYFEEEISTLIGAGNKTSAVLIASFCQGDENPIQTLYYFDSPKNLKLRKSEINHQSVVKDDHLHVTLSSDFLVKNTCITVEGLEGNFTDNFFDLLPLEPKTVSIKLPGEFDAAAPKLKILSVNDASLYP